MVDGQPECNGCMTENDCNSQYSIGTVCGSDTNDYISECILGVTACINQDLALQKVYDGKCAQGTIFTVRSISIPILFHLPVI